jgi:hypothetical protein
MTHFAVCWSHRDVEAVRKEGEMSQERVSELRSLEGHQVSVALADGSRIDDCQLVSAGRPGVQTLWVFTNGADTFVPLPDIIDVWELRAA